MHGGMAVRRRPRRRDLRVVVADGIARRPSGRLGLLVVVVGCAALAVALILYFKGAK
jgi:hypothetical protein